MPRSSRRLAASSRRHLTDAGEMIAPRTPLLVVTDLDRAWANLFVPEPLMPRSARPGRHRADRCRRLVPGKVTFISPQAEFTPRNVQTADERSKLVYRIKVAVDNSAGVLKQGMPVDAELTPAARAAIEMSGVSKRYGATEALNAVTLQVQRGRDVRADRLRWSGEDDGDPPDVRAAARRLRRDSRPRP